MSPLSLLLSAGSPTSVASNLAYLPSLSRRSGLSLSNLPTLIHYWDDESFLQSTHRHPLIKFSKQHHLPAFSLLPLSFGRLLSIHMHQSNILSSNKILPLHCCFDITGFNADQYYFNVYLYPPVWVYSSVVSFYILENFWGHSHCFSIPRTWWFWSGTIS